MPRVRLTPSDVYTLSFPTTQTCSDGTVGNWDQPSVEGQDEPEHPVHTLERGAAPQAADPAATFGVVGRRRQPA